MINKAVTAINCFGIWTASGEDIHSKWLGMTYLRRWKDNETRYI